MDFSLKKKINFFVFYFITIIILTALRIYLRITIKIKRDTIPESKGEIIQEETKILNSCNKKYFEIILNLILKSLPIFKISIHLMTDIPLETIAIPIVAPTIL